MSFIQAGNRLECQPKLFIAVPLKTRYLSYSDSNTLNPFSIQFIDFLEPNESNANTFVSPYS